MLSVCALSAKMSQNKCCVPGCSMTRNQGVPLHLFPNPETVSERYEAWIRNIGGDLLELDSVTIHHNRRICHKHFDKIHYNPNNRLCSLAIPILSSESRNESRMEPANARNDTELQDLQAPEIRIESRMELANAHTEFQDLQAPEIQIKNRIIRVWKAPVPGKCTPKQLREYTKLVNKLKKMEKDKSSLKNKLLVAKVMKTAIFKKLSQTAKLFCGNQVSQTEKKSKGRRFSLDEKIMCLSLYKNSPRAYRFLRRMIILPSRRTVLSLSTNAMICSLDLLTMATIKRKHVLIMFWYLW